MNNLTTTIASLFQQAQAYAADCQWDEARMACKEILAYDPAQFETHMLLGLLHQQATEYQDALGLFREASKLQPKRAEPYFRTGETLATLGNLEQARVSLHKAITLNPDFATAYIHLGLAYHATGSSQEAIAYLKKAISIQPESAIAYNNLGMVIHEISEGSLSEAEQYYKKALELDPNLAQPYANLGYILTQQGDYDASIELYKQARKLNPGLIDAYAGEAAALERRGEITDAYELIKPFINTKTSSAKLALAFSKLHRHHGQESEAVKLLENALTLPATQRNDRIEVHFALGKLYNQREAYDVAFTHYQAANKLKNLSFSHLECEAQVQRISNVFNKSFMESAPRANTVSSPIFVVGMSRSGTSLTEQILSMHPDVYAAGELTAVLEITTSLPKSIGTELQFPDYMRLIDQDGLSRAAESHLQMLSRLSDNSPRVTDKMPSNYTLLGLITLLFPNARIIHCNRHPLDTCLSCYFQHFSKGHLYSYKLEDLGFYYRQYRAMMNHWHQVLTVPILELQYEELVSDTETVVRYILNFCDLEWHPGCLDFHRSKRIVQTASYDQVRQPIYSKSSGRWIHYEKYLGTLIEAIGHEHMQSDA